MEKENPKLKISLSLTVDALDILSTESSKEGISRSDYINQLLMKIGEIEIPFHDEEVDYREEVKNLGWKTFELKDYEVRRLVAEKNGDRITHLVRVGFMDYIMPPDMSVKRCNEGWKDIYQAISKKI